MRSKLIADLMLPRGAKRSPSKRTVRPHDNPALQEIWQVVGAIPHGKVSTYGAVARAAGLPGRARLAGLALRLVPPEMNLPWHRVVGAGGRIVFPRNSPQYREQARRLRAEGAMKDGRIKAASMTDLEEL